MSISSASVTQKSPTEISRPQGTLALELYGRNTLSTFDALEICLCLIAEHIGDEVRGEAFGLDVVSLHSLVEVLAGNSICF